MTGHWLTDVLATIVATVLGWLLLVIVARTIFRLYFQSKAEYTAGMLNHVCKKESTNGKDEE